MRTLLLAAAAIGLIGGAGVSTATRASSPAPDAFRVPFRVGEELTYQAKLNFVNAGSASMTVNAIEQVRGHTTYHTTFDVKGRVLFFHVNNHYESWFDTTTLVSLRHIQHVDESKNSTDRTYEFYPERQVYVRNDVENPSVSEPLDEASFIYFMRSMPLEVGKTYEFNCYYHPDRNPVVIKVDRKERITVPAGEFDAIVVKPTIKSKGMFSENGQAEVWFADDSTRKLLRLKSKLSFGTLYLELKHADYAIRR